MKYAGKGNSEKILAAAAAAVREWNSNGITLDDCVEKLRREEPDVARSVSSILFEYFRHKAFLDDLVMGSVSKGTIKPELKSVALCALTQALFQTAIATESAVNVAVDHIKNSKHRSASGFLNAVLRNALRTAGKGPFEPSFPPELKKRWEETFGKAETDVAVRACSINPPITFRLRSGDLPEELTDCVPVDAEFAGEFRFFECASPDVLFQSDAFLNGSIYIQDPATAMSISLCSGLVKGKVLDACAAPGGKTVMLYDLCRGDAEFVAADRSAARIVQMKENFTRLHLDSVVTVETDAAKPEFEAETFDLVFIDAPCSNTGVARRRPDVPWRFDSKRLSEVVSLQKKILDGVAPLVKKGGALLYSTCSVEAEEDSRQIESFLKRHPEFAQERTRILLPSLEHDGAFASLLIKK